MHCDGCKLKPPCYSSLWRLKITESLTLPARRDIFRTLKFCHSQIVGAVSVLCVFSPLEFGCLSCFGSDREQRILKKHLQEVWKHREGQRWPLLRPNLASCQVPKTYVWQRWLCTTKLHGRICRAGTSTNSVRARRHVSPWLLSRYKSDCCLGAEWNLSHSQ